ncbi:helix-hairpin-helix domain-containing protein [Apilactobacillus apisilvae]|uniref:Helix-hairpin-helix domain-containing protein n=1 Tax=Apilactobacillus apisilvae TaxID=2923364 RepID=A0ABY4PJ83_9LACO|nr:helix-hairpin-helix domain-containing protein [Apilactobacillus apisilvae]UQS85516.1 helix-hairpin-helix domain-containing protein [Apilactobacillus apisilvae]
MNKIENFIYNIKGFALKYFYQMMIVLILILISLGLMFIVYFQNHSNDNAINSYPISNSSYSKNIETSSLDNNIYVDIKGEVNAPGVYKCNKDDRVTDIIKYAGGFKRLANQSSVNLAQKIYDQQVVIVNKKTNNNTQEEQDSNTNNRSKVNLNTADKNELQKLDSVGDKNADKIIDYRNQNNGFHNVDELKKVSGFGDKTFEKLKDYLEI